MDDKIYISGLMETPQMRKGGYSSQGKKGSASRVFNCAITKRCDYNTVETENGYLVWIKGIMNNSRMRENGFSKQVCKTFMGGFPNQWKELLDSNMEDIDEHSQSPLNSADAALDELLLEKFMSDTFASKKEYSFAESNFSSFRNLESFDFEEPGTSKCYKTSVNLGTQNASEVPAAGMTPLSGAVRVSEKNEVRTLRSGLVLGGPISAPRTGVNKRKRAQHKASNNKMSPNEAVSPTVDLTSHGNDPSPARIVAEDKLQSHDSPSKGQSDYLGRRKLAKRRLAKKRESRMLFQNFI